MTKQSKYPGGAQAAIALCRASQRPRTAGARRTNSGGTVSGAKVSSRLCRGAGQCLDGQNICALPAHSASGGASRLPPLQCPATSPAAPRKPRATTASSPDLGRFLFYSPPPPAAPMGQV